MFHVYYREAGGPSYFFSYETMEELQDSYMREIYALSDSPAGHSLVNEIQPEDVLECPCGEYQKALFEEALKAEEKGMVRPFIIICLDDGPIYEAYQSEKDVDWWGLFKYFNDLWCTEYEVHPMLFKTGDITPEEADRNGWTDLAAKLRNFKV